MTLTWKTLLTNIAIILAQIDILLFLFAAVQMLIAQALDRGPIARSRRPLCAIMAWALHSQEKTPCRAGTSARSPIGPG